MKYNPHQKVYFKLETVESILNDIELEICDMNMQVELDDIIALVNVIADAAYNSDEQCEDN